MSKAVFRIARLSRLFCLSVCILLNAVYASADSLENVLQSSATRVIDPYAQDQEVQVKCSGWAEKKWDVHLDNGVVQITGAANSEDGAKSLPFDIPDDPAIPSSHQRKISFPVDDGYLVSFDAGEWGSTLWWYAKDGKTKKVMMRNSPENLLIGSVKEFMSTRDGLYLLQGRAHLSFDVGGVAKVEATEKGWVVTRFVNFSSTALRYFQMDDDHFLILAEKKVVLFGLNGGSKTLYEPLDNARYLGSGGTSIVQDNKGVIYIGGNYKIVRLKPVMGGYQEDWIIPQYCQWDVSPNGICKCRS